MAKLTQFQNFKELFRNFLKHLTQNLINLILKVQTLNLKLTPKDQMSYQDQAKIIKHFSNFLASVLLKR